MGALIRERMRTILDTAGSPNLGFFRETWEVTSLQDWFYSISGFDKESFPAMIRRGFTSCNGFAIWVLVTHCREWNR